MAKSLIELNDNEIIKMFPEDYAMFSYCNKMYLINKATKEKDEYSMSLTFRRVLLLSFFKYIKRYKEIKEKRFGEHTPLEEAKKEFGKRWIVSNSYTITALKPMSGQQKKFKWKDETGYEDNYTIDDFRSIGIDIINKFDKFMQKNPEQIILDYDIGYDIKLSEDIAICGTVHLLRMIQENSIHKLLKPQIVTFTFEQDFSKTIQNLKKKQLKDQAIELGQVETLFNCFVMKIMHNQKVSENLKINIYTDESVLFSYKNIHYDQFKYSVKSVGKCIKNQLFYAVPSHKCNVCKYTNRCSQSLTRLVKKIKN